MLQYPLRQSQGPTRYWVHTKLSRQTAVVVLKTRAGLQTRGPLLPNLPSQHSKCNEYQYSLPFVHQGPLELAPVMYWC